MCRLLIILTVVLLFPQLIKADEITNQCPDFFQKEDSIIGIHSYAIELSDSIVGLNYGTKIKQSLLDDPTEMEDLASMLLDDYLKMTNNSITQLTKNEIEQLKEVLLGQFLLEQGPIGKSSLIAWGIVNQFSSVGIKSYADFVTFRNLVFGTSKQGKITREKLINNIQETITNFIQIMERNNTIMNLDNLKSLSSLVGAEINTLPVIFDEWQEAIFKNPMAIHRMILKSFHRFTEKDFSRLAQTKIPESVKSTPITSLSSLPSPIGNNNFEFIPEQGGISNDDLDKMIKNQASFISNDEMQSIENNLNNTIQRISLVNKSIKYTAQAISILFPVILPKVILSQLRRLGQFDYSKYLLEVKNNFKKMNQEQFDRVFLKIYSLYQIVRHPDVLNAIIGPITLLDSDEYFITLAKKDGVYKKEFSRKFMNEISSLYNEMGNFAISFTKIKMLQERIDYLQKVKNNLELILKQGNQNGITYEYIFTQLNPYLKKETNSSEMKNLFIEEFAVREYFYPRGFYFRRMNNLDRKWLFSKNKNIPTSNGPFFYDSHFTEPGSYNIKPSSTYINPEISKRLERLKSTIINAYSPQKANLIIDESMRNEIKNIINYLNTEIDSREKLKTNTMVSLRSLLNE